VKTLLYALASALIQRGLHVTVGRDATVEARHPGVAGSTVVGRALCPGLRQTVALRPHEGALWWQWVWSGPARDAPPELEPLCPAVEIERAAERIAVVLALEPAAG
jgi:hypothetical protein